jgi:hypothetical protein
MTPQRSRRTDMVMLAKAGSWCMNSSSCSVAGGSRGGPERRETRRHQPSLTRPFQKDQIGSTKHEINTFIIKTLNKRTQQRVHFIHRREFHSNSRFIHMYCYPEDTM